MFINVNTFVGRTSDITFLMFFLQKRSVLFALQGQNIHDKRPHQSKSSHYSKTRGTSDLLPCNTSTQLPIQLGRTIGFPEEPQDCQILCLCPTCIAAITVIPKIRLAVCICRHFNPSLFSFCKQSNSIFLPLRDLHAGYNHIHFIAIECVAQPPLKGQHIFGSQLHFAVLELVVWPALKDQHVSGNQLHYVVLKLVMPRFFSLWVKSFINDSSLLIFIFIDQCYQR